MNNSGPIGIFDSGIGGLTVLKEISRVLPDEHIVYLGDTARVPYGVKSSETIARYSFECAEFLLGQNIKLLVIACNTASAISLRKIQKKVSIPVIGVIEPGASAAVSSTKNKRIGIIGTEATIKSNAYPKAIKALGKDIEVFGLSCPLFVPLAEEGLTDGTIARMIAERYLKNTIDKADTLILGCTHYPLLKKVIQDILGDVCLIDSAVETAMTVKETLLKKGALRMLDEKNKLRTEDSNKVMRKFCVTDSPERFISVGERFLQSKIDNIEKINLGRRYNET